jgi:hypothetical protein
MKNFFSWIAKLLSESPEASFGRFATFLCLIFCFGWDSASLTFIFYNWKLLHPQLSDLWVPAATLAGQGAFCLLFYGTNKIAATVQNGNK